MTAKSKDKQRQGKPNDNEGNQRWNCAKQLKKIQPKIIRGLSGVGGCGVGAEPVFLSFMAHKLSFRASL